jgi:hypothetical protein
LGPLEEVGSNAVADCFTLGDEFCSIELGDNGLEDFVADGRQNSLVVILTKVLVSLATYSYILHLHGNILGRSSATAEPLVYARP